MFKPKDLEYYKSLTAGGELNVKFAQDEACVMLKVHDYGVDALSDDEKQILYRAVGKLKDQIWP